MENVRKDREDDAPFLRHLRVFRVILMGMGGSIIAFALFMDKVGYGMPGSFGIGQLLLLLVGSLILLVGLTGTKFILFYRGAAIIILNTFLLLAFLELGAIMVSRLGLLPSNRTNLVAHYHNIPYYASESWAQTYWKETVRAEQYRYRPYVLWRHRKFVGETVNIDAEGIRLTPGANCTQDALKVFVFGGSTMWGWGSPDWGTIAAYFQKGVEETTGKPVCTVNFGEDGYVSTQSLLELIKQLQLGNMPDMVMFYDGVNDVYAPHISGHPGDHVRMTTIKSRLEKQEHPLVQWIHSTRFVSLITRITQPTQKEERGASQETLTDQENASGQDNMVNLITETYLNNYRIVSGLGREYGFKYAFFWQPHIAVGDKTLTDDEHRLRSELDPALIQLARATYENLSSASTSHEHLFYIARAFDHQDDQIWTDSWGHVTPEGNRIIAQEMIHALELQRSLPD